MAHRMPKPAGSTRRPLDELRSGVARGPRPLEVVAAEPSRHVDDLADEMQSREPLRRAHGLGRQLRACPRHPASLRPCCIPSVPEGSTRQRCSCRDRSPQIGDSALELFRRQALVRAPPLLRERAAAAAARARCRACAACRCALFAQAIAAASASGSRSIDERRSLPSQYEEICRIAGSRQSAMREQEVLAKASRRCTTLRRRARHAGEIAIAVRAHSGCERERHERRGDGGTTARPNCRDAVAERRRADLRHGEPAGRDHQRFAAPPRPSPVSRLSTPRHRRDRRHRPGMAFATRRRPRSHSAFGASR